MNTALRHKVVLAALVASTLFPGLGSSHETATVRYDFAGRLVLLDLGGGHSVQYFYDASGNLLRRLIITNTDGDADGLDDTWEMFFFGTLARNGADDFDGDGQSDLSEFLAGTDPTNPDSLLRVSRDLALAGGVVNIQWDAIAGRKYRLQFKNTLRDVGWQDVVGDVVAGGNTASKTDVTGANLQRYYRVITVP